MSILFASLLGLAVLCGYLWIGLLFKSPSKATRHDDSSSYLSSYSSSIASSIYLTKFNANTDNPRVLNVHMIPHTHDDVGWLKTVEQYFEDACNDTIDSRGNVRGIISTTIQALLENDARTFVYVEMKFFKMWWDEQSDSIKDSVRYLIANQQVSFANGGYCMHDEASTHYIGMMDQTTLGHDFLQRELGVVPTVGWQLDPFGHSATQASLLTARAGFDALYFGRVDYQDLQLRQLTQECEGLWNASRYSGGNGGSSSGFDSTVFWGLTGSYQGNYGPPDGFWFDVLTPDNEPLVGMEESKRLDRIHTFLQDLRVQADRTKGNHIMITLGSDFHFREAHYNFQNYDLLISAIMEYQQWGVVDISAVFGPQYDEINVFYSSPEYYTKMKHQQSTQQAAAASSLAENDDTRIEWSVKADDFFPYSDCPNCFWTGYFTSRTAFKRFERVASGFLLAARQIEAKAAPPSLVTRIKGRLRALEDALGIVQHHDAVSGTAKQHVADDYSKRLQAGLNQAAAFVAEKLKHIMLQTPTTVLEDLAYCHLLNETICEVSETATMDKNRVLTVIVYNPLATERSHIVRLPVASDAEFRVIRIGNSDDNDETKRLAQSILDPRTHLGDGAKHVLLFDTGPLPPAGAAAFRITKARGTTDMNREASVLQNVAIDDASKSIEISNEFLSVSFDRSTGMMHRVTSEGVVLNVEQEWGYYTSFDSSFDSSDDGARQNSGAYIFRPSEPELQLVPLTPSQGKATFINTTVGTEVHVAFEESWVHQVTRIFHGQPFIEVEYTVGPVPIDDGRGKEIVTRWNTEIQSKGIFYTDSNGREFQQRRRNYRPSWKLDVYEPVTGNYYPVNAAIYIEDESHVFAVLTDRSQGGASLSDGAVELMVQRRTLVDDGRGVDEPMNETVGGMTAYPPYGDATRVGEGVIIRGTHRIMVGKGPVGAKMARSAMDAVFAQPLIFVGSSEVDQTIDFRRPTFSLVTSALPPNVMLITFAELPLDEQGRPQFLLRLGHQSEASPPASVDLTSFLADYQIVDVNERTLSGNQNWDDFLKRRLVWGTPHADSSIKSTSSLGPNAIVLHPMDIRTFYVTVQQRMKGNNVVMES